MPWPRCGKSAGEKVVVVSRSACLLAPALPPTPSLENARKTVTPTPVAQSRTAGASLVDIVQVAAFACQAACRRNGKRDHGAGPASCSPLPAGVSLSTSTHYQTQIFDLVFDVHVSAQRLSCVGILVRTAKHARCLRQAPYLRQQAPLTPKAPTRPKTMILKYDQNQSTNNCTDIVAVPLEVPFLKPFLVMKFRSIFGRGNAAQIRSQVLCYARFYFYVGISMFASTPVRYRACTLQT